MKTLEIDVLKLYAGKIKNFEDTKAWNRWLTKCLKNDNLDELMNVRKGLQMGMATVQRNGMVMQEVADTFCRWTGSIESTARKIIKKRHLMANDSTKNKQFQTADSLVEKRQRDAEFEKFLRKSSY